MRLVSRLIHIVRRIPTVLRLVITQAARLIPAWRYRIVMPAAGLGDLIMYAEATRAYKRRFPRRKVAFVCGERENLQLQVLGLMDVVDKVIKIPIESVRHCYLPWVERSRKVVRQLPFSDHVEENFAKALHPSLAYAPRCYGKCVGPSVEVLGLFAKGELKKGEVVVLCPGANSYSREDEVFWIELARAIARKGYTPVFNNNKPELYTEFKSVFLKIVDMIAFMELCGQVITVRSGMSDVAAYFTRAKLISLFPTDWQSWSPVVAKKWMSRGCVDPSKEFMNAWSLKRIFPRDGIIELAWDEKLDVGQIVELL